MGVMYVAGATSGRYVGQTWPDLAKLVLRYRRKHTFRSAPFRTVDSPSKSVRNCQNPSESMLELTENAHVCMQEHHRRYVWASGRMYAAGATSGRYVGWARPITSLCVVFAAPAKRTCQTGRMLEWGGKHAIPRDENFLREGGGRPGILSSGSDVGRLPACVNSGP